MFPVFTFFNPLRLLPPPVLPKKLALVHRTGSTYGALDPLFVVGAGAAILQVFLTFGVIGALCCFGIFIFGMEQHEQQLQQSQGAQHAQQGAQHGAQFEVVQQVGAQHAAHKDPHVLHELHGE